MRDRNHRFQYGSARWADEEDLENAKLFGDDGLPFGFFENRLLRYTSDAPRILIGGAGAGKLTGILAYQLCLPSSMSMAILDPKGELWDISVGTLARQNIFGYSWDPYQIGDVSHSINPLDHLKPGRLTLFAEVVRLASALIPLSQSSSGKYFELTAQNVLIALIYHEVLVFGGIDFPRLYELIHMIEGDLNAWIATLDSMLKTGILFLTSGANTIMRSQQDTPKEFGAVMGEIYAYMRWLSDDPVRESLKGGDASLQEMVNSSLNGGHKVRFHFKVPGDLMEHVAPILRVFFDVIMVLKERERGSERILLMIDEAALLGPFAELKKAFTYGRGTGTITVAVFQDLQQIESNFGKPGITTFLGSAAHRQFIGPRDIYTANVISSMCSYETLEYDDAHRQAAAHHYMMEQVHAMLSGADPFSTGQKISHFQATSERKSKIKRALIDPGEVLAMRSDEAISFIDGDDLPPIFHNKHPYFERLGPGQFFPNPAHPPTDRILVRRGWRKTWLTVKRIVVPPQYAHFPQYCSGYALEIEGHPL